MSRASDAMVRRCLIGVSTAILISATARTGHAQVPEHIYQAMLKIGQVVDPSCTAKLYRPLMPANDYDSGKAPLYPGLTLHRDQSFGAHPRDLADIFVADRGDRSRPVLIYVPGGGGNKIEQQVKEGHAFYDNIGRWAAKNGMVGVLMQRHPGANWDDPAKDVATLIQWLQANAARYQGNPDRMFIWAHSAGNGPVGTYLGRPELHGAKGVGLKGAIMMSGQWNVAPLAIPPAGGAGAPGAVTPPPAAGTTCGAGGPASVGAPITGPSAATPPPARGGAPAAAVPVGAGRGGGVDAETLLARSTLTALKTTKVALFFATAELDPGISGAMSPFYQTLATELCTGGPAQCPTLLFAKRHNHMSIVFSPDTADTTVSDPVLAWMRRIR